MSDSFKLKYEVIAILKENIQKGLEAFGLPIADSPSSNGWIVMESDQPSVRKAGNAVLFWMEKVERLWGIGYEIGGYDEETRSFESKEKFKEQQVWKIKIIASRSTAPVTDDNIPVCSEDIASMLTGWFNHLGREFFALYGLTNLFIMAKDIKSYNDESNVNQRVTEFPLNIMIEKNFVAHLPAATLDDRGVTRVN